MAVSTASFTVPSRCGALIDPFRQLQAAQHLQVLPGTSTRKKARNTTLARDLLHTSARSGADQITTRRAKASRPIRPDPSSSGVDPTRPDPSSAAVDLTRPGLKKLRSEVTRPEYPKITAEKLYLYKIHRWSEGAAAHVSAVLHAASAVAQAHLCARVCGQAQMCDVCVCMDLCVSYITIYISIYIN